MRTEKTWKEGRRWRLLASRYSCIANTSLEGARILLLDRGRLREMEALLEGMYCVQFASAPDFLVRMQAAKFLPHTDMDRFPSVKRWKGSLGSPG